MNESNDMKSENKFLQFVKKVWLPPVLVGVLAPLLALCGVLFLPEQLSQFLFLFKEHLPLTLPILMVIISIGVRINELNRRQGWLDTCNSFASGYVTFATWALVSGESVKQYISINKGTFLHKSYAVPLIVSAFGLLAVCSLVTVLAKNSEGNEQSKKGWQTVQALFVGISLLALFYPTVLFEKRETIEKRTGESPDPKSFTVSITYRDPSFDAHYLGSSSDPIRQCAIFHSVIAENLKAAKDSTLNSFMASEKSYQKKAKEPKKVEIERIVAEADENP